MEDKLKWFREKKEETLKELNDLQSSNQTYILQLVSERNRFHYENLKLKNHIEANLKEQKEVLEAQLHRCSALETIIVNKEDIIQQNILLIEKLNRQIADSHNNCKKLTDELQKSDHAHNQLQKQCQIDKQAQQCRQKKMIQSYEKQIDDLKTNFAKQFTKQASQTKSHYEAQLTELRTNNIALVQKLQLDYSNSTTKLSEKQKQLDVEHARLIAENNIYLLTINELKIKIVDLEGTVDNIGQINKAIRRELEVAKEAQKREGLFLKEEVGALGEKNKKLTAKIDEMVWNAREQALLREQQGAKMRLQIEKSLNECLLKAKQEIDDRNTVITQLSNDISGKDRILEENARAFQKKQVELLQLREDIQHFKAQLKTISKTAQEQSNRSLGQINIDLKKELTRKDCEVEVLQEEIKRLKAKVNKLAAINEQYTKSREIIEKQNKMLLSQIVFLREQDKKAQGGKQSKKNQALLISSGGSLLAHMNSDQSEQLEQIETYKAVIKQLEEGMNEALKKIIDKDTLIEKQRGMIARMQKLITAK